MNDAILMFSDEDYWAAKDVSAKNGGIAMFVRQGATRVIPADALNEYFGVAEPPIRSTLSHCLAENEPLCCWLNH